MAYLQNLRREKRGRKGIAARGEEMEGGDGCDSTLKIIGELMPAVKSRCWRKKLKVVAQRT